jgi:hypothetical protein
LVQGIQPLLQLWGKMLARPMLLKGVHRSSLQVLTASSEFSRPLGVYY